MEDFYYFCIGNGRKGPISRMSDECLIRLETVFSYCYDCQAVMRKFTLAIESYNFFLWFSVPCGSLDNPAGDGV